MPQRRRGILAQTRPGKEEVSSGQGSDSGIRRVPGMNRAFRNRRGLVSGLNLPAWDDTPGVVDSDPISGHEIDRAFARFNLFQDSYVPFAWDDPAAQYAGPCGDNFTGWYFDIPHTISQSYVAKPLDFTSLFVWGCPDGDHPAPFAGRDLNFVYYGFNNPVLGYDTEGFYAPAAPTFVAFLSPEYDPASDLADPDVDCQSREGDGGFVWLEEKDAAPTAHSPENGATYPLVQANGDWESAAIAGGTCYDMDNFDFGYSVTKNTTPHPWVDDYPGTPIHQDGNLFHEIAPEGVALASFGYATQAGSATLSNGNVSPFNLDWYALPTTDTRTEELGLIEYTKAIAASEYYNWELMGSIAGATCITADPFDFCLPDQLPNEFILATLALAEDFTANVSEVTIFPANSLALLQHKDTAVAERVVGAQLNRNAPVYYQLSNNSYNSWYFTALSSCDDCAQSQPSNAIVGLLSEYTEEVGIMSRFPTEYQVPQLTSNGCGDFNETYYCYEGLCDLYINTYDPIPPPSPNWYNAGNYRILAFEQCGGGSGYPFCFGQMDFFCKDEVTTDQVIDAYINPAYLTLQLEAGFLRLSARSFLSDPNVYSFAYSKYSTPERWLLNVANEWNSNTCTGGDFECEWAYELGNTSTSVCGTVSGDLYLLVSDGYQVVALGPIGSLATDGTFTRAPNMDFINHRTEFHPDCYTYPGALSGGGGCVCTGSYGSCCYRYLYGYSYDCYDCDPSNQCAYPYYTPGCVVYSSIDCCCQPACYGYNGSCCYIGCVGYIYDCGTCKSYPYNYGYYSCGYRWGPGSYSYCLYYYQYPYGTQYCPPPGGGGGGGSNTAYCGCLESSQANITYGFQLHDMVFPLHALLPVEFESYITNRMGIDYDQQEVDGVVGAPLQNGVGFDVVGVRLFLPEQANTVSQGFGCLNAQATPYPYYCYWNDCSGDGLSENLTSRVYFGANNLRLT